MIARMPSLSEAKFWLACITAGVMAIHITLVGRTDSDSLFASSVLFLASVGSLLWTRRNSLKLHHNLPASAIGAILLGLVLIKSTAITGGFFLRAYPFVAGVAIALMASGFQGLRQYWKELILLFFLGMPEVILTSLFDISPLTAHLTYWLLKLGQYDVVREGVNIYLPGGAIEVYHGCSGLQSIAQLLGFSVLFLFMLPNAWRWWQQLSIPLLGITLAFVINGFRVALMAVLVASGDMEKFDYWHVGDGSLIFSVVAALSFMAIYMGLNSRSSRKPSLN